MNKPSTSVRSQSVASFSGASRGGVHAGARCLALAVLAGSMHTAVLADGPMGPVNPQVVQGGARFNQFGNRFLITTSTRNTIINYSSFNLSRDQAVRFQQPDSTSRVLNRITGGDPTSINGRIDSNGIVYFVNPAGVTFGPNATINVGQFYAAAGALSDRDFLAGHDRFTGLTGAVNNYGRITAGSVTLAGGRVANYGHITGINDSVVMASGEEVVVQRAGDNLVVRVAGDANATEQAGVTNTGTVTARRRISMASGDMASLAISNTGTLRAQDVSMAARNGNVQVSGRVDASSQTGRGGTVTITGDRVAVTGATIDASGATGGGQVNIGGNQQGVGELQNSRSTFVSRDSVVRADATVAGNGGRIIVWSNEATGFMGSASASGAGASGNGGFIETSSAGSLTVAPLTLSAVGSGTGQAGTWLIDPSDITIVSGVAGAPVGGAFGGGNPDVFNPGPADATSTITDGTINAALDTGGGTSVTINTANAAGGTGTITLDAAAAILYSGTNNVTLTFNAVAGFTAQAGSSISTGGVGVGTLGVTINASGVIDLLGTISTNGGALSVTNGAANAVTVGGNITTTPSVVNGNGGSVTFTGGSSFTQNAGVTMNTSGAGSGTGGAIGLAPTGTVTVNGTVTSGGANVSATGTGFTLGATGALNLGTGNLAVDVTGPVDLNGAVTGATTGAGSTIRLRGTSITQGVGGTLTGGSLLAIATGGTITLDQSITLRQNTDTVATPGVFASSSTGQLVLVATDALTIGQIGASGTFALTNGVTTTNSDGSITLTTGALAFEQAVNIGTGVLALTLNGTGDLTQTGAGTLTAGTLRITQGGGDVVLTLAGNNVGVLEADVTGAGNSLRYRDTNALTIGGAGGLAGVSVASDFITIQTGGLLTISEALSSSSDITIDSAAGATQNGTGAITAANLLLLGTGDFDLRDAGVNNDVDVLAANITGGASRGVQFRDDDGFDIGTVSAVTGINLGGAAANRLVSLQSDGVVTQSQAIVGGELVLRGSGDFCLLNAGNNVLTVAGDISGAAGTRMGFRDDTGFAVGTVDGVAGLTVAGTAGGDNNIIELVSNGTVTQSGAMNAEGLLLLGTGTFTLTNASNNLPVLAINGATRADVRSTGDWSIGSLTSCAPAATPTAGISNVTDLCLVVDAGSTLTQTSSILATNLALTGGGAFTLTTDTNDVSVLAANTAGAVEFNDANLLTVGTACGVTGITLTGATLADATLTLRTGRDLSAAGSANRLSIVQPINVGADVGQVTIVSRGGVSGAADNTNADGAITADRLLITNDGGNVLLGRAVAGVPINNINSVEATLNTLNNRIEVRTTGALTIGGIDAGTAGISTNDGRINLQSTGAMTLNEQVNAGATVGTNARVILQSGAGITQPQPGTGVITASELELDGTGAFLLNAQDNNVVLLGAANMTGAGNSIRFRSLTALAQLSQIGAPLSPASLGLVEIQTNNTVTQAGVSTIRCDTLVLSGQGAFRLDSTGNPGFGIVNDVNTLVVQLTDGGAGLDPVSFLVLRDNNGFSIGQAQGTDANLSDGTLLTLNGVEIGDNTAFVAGNVLDIITATGGAVTQTQPILTNSVILRGLGTFTLTGGNNITALGASNAGAIAFRDINALEIGDVTSVAAGTVAGIDNATSNSNVTLLVDAGGLVLNRQVNLGAPGASGVVRISSNGGVTQNVATDPTRIISAGSLLVINAGSGAIDLSTQNNTVGTLAMSQTGGGAVSFRGVGTGAGTTSYTIGTVTGDANLDLNGATAGNGEQAGISMGTTALLTLRSDNGNAAIANQAAALVTPQLELVVGTDGGFDFGTVNNDVDFIGARADNGATSGNNVLRFRDNDGFTIGAGTTGAPLNVGGANGINLGTQAGDLVALRSDGVVNQTQALVAALLVLRGDGDFVLTNTANDVDTIAGSVGTVASASTATARIGFFDLDGFDIGTVDTVNGLTVNNQNNTGPTATSNNIVELRGTAVTQSQPIVAEGLLLRGTNSTYTLGNAANVLPNLAAVTTGGSTIAVRSTGNMVIGALTGADATAVNGVNGTAGGGDSLNFTVRLDTANASLTQTQAIRATNLGLLGAMDAILANTGNDVATFAAGQNPATAIGNPRDITFRNDGSFTIGTVNPGSADAAVFPTLSGATASGLLDFDAIGAGQTISLAGDVISTVAAGSVNNAGVLRGVILRDALVIAGNRTINGGAGIVRVMGAIDSAAANTNTLTILSDFPVAATALLPGQSSNGTSNNLPPDVPAIGLAGSIGAGAAFQSVQLGANRTVGAGVPNAASVVFATNWGSLGAGPNFAFVPFSPANGTGSPYRAQATQPASSFTVAAQNNVTMGNLQRVLALGNLTLNSTAGAVRFGDLTAVGNLNVNANTIQFVTRPVGTIIRSNRQSESEATAHRNDTNGADVVANTINLSTAPTIVLDNGVAGGVNNTNIFSIATSGVGGSNIPGFTNNNLVRVRPTATNAPNGDLTLAAFRDAAPGGATLGSILAIDADASGTTQVNATQPVIFTFLDLPEVDRGVRITGALERFLRENLGLQVTSSSPEQLADGLLGRTLMNNGTVLNTSDESAYRTQLAQPGVHAISVGRMSDPVVREARDRYGNIFFGQGFDWDRAEAGDTAMVAMRDNPRSAQMRAALGALVGQWTSQTGGGAGMADLAAFIDANGPEVGAYIGEVRQFLTDFSFAGPTTTEFSSVYDLFIAPLRPTEDDGGRLEPAQMIELLTGQRPISTREVRTIEMRFNDLFLTQTTALDANGKPMVDGSTTERFKVMKTSFATALRAYANAAGNAGDPDGFTAYVNQNDPVAAGYLREVRGFLRDLDGYASQTGLPREWYEENVTKTLNMLRPNNIDAGLFRQLLMGVGQPVSMAW
jgi:filamentous hemagglutinin family protein